VFLDLAAVWSDDDKVGLVSGVLSQFEELDARGLARRVKHLRFNRPSNSAPSPSRSRLPARANDIGSAGNVRVRLIDCKNSNEPGIAPTCDTNLLAHGATDVSKASRISRAAFRVVLQRILLGQAKLQDSRIVCCVRGVCICASSW
jgi:hypothetical protein